MTNDESKAIDLEVSGPNAVQKTKAMLSGYDVDDDDITRVSICVYEADTPDVDTPPRPEASDGSNDDDGRERELQGVQPQSTYHLVLAAIEQADEPISAGDLGDAMGVPQNPVSTVLSKLYYRKLVDRNDGQRPYTYYITAYGEAELSEIGRDVEPDDCGGVWANE